MPGSVFPTRPGLLTLVRRVGSMTQESSVKELPPALSLLSSERPRNLGWPGAAGLLFGDWGTSRLYVLGLAFLVGGRSSFWLICAMSLLILAVGWCYTQICRIFQTGGGVYSSGRQRAPIVGVIGALLLCADYTVTASLSAVEAFHYFGLGYQHTATETADDPGKHIHIPHHKGDSVREPLADWRSPGLWAIIAILLIGAFNLLGPKHTAGYAIFTAAGMIGVTLLITVFALPQIKWSQLDWGQFWHAPADMWHGFVYIVLGLSGVEAIANLTGVMKRPVAVTARKAIWPVAIEVAVFNLLLAIVMISLASASTSPTGQPIGREDHTEDMLAFMAKAYIGPFGEWAVRIIGGLLLLSATNTAVNGLMSIIYVMSRDRELPAIFQKLNGFGAPWIAAVAAAGIPAVVLLFAHDLKTLASLYAIGVVGAIAIEAMITTFHPRLRKWYRRLAMLLIGLLLVAIWITLAMTKIEALIFVTVVLATGLLARRFTKWAAARRPRPSLLQQAIMEQLTPEALAKPKLLLATAGSDAMAPAALAAAKAENAALVVCFVREVSLSYKVGDEGRLNLSTDLAAQELFTEFLEHGHREGVPIIPMYDTGPSSAELIAEHAALNAVQAVLIGTSRRGAFHKLVKGSFQKKLESLLPPEIPVRVLSVAG